MQSGLKSLNGLLEIAAPDMSLSVPVVQRRKVGPIFLRLVQLQHGFADVAVAQIEPSFDQMGHGVPGVFLQESFVQRLSRFPIVQIQTHFNSFVKDIGIARVLLEQPIEFGFSFGPGVDLYVKIG